MKEKDMVSRLLDWWRMRQSRRDLEADADAVALQRDDLYNRLNRIHAAADADLAGAPALRDFLLRESEVARLPSALIGYIPEPTEEDGLRGVYHSEGFWSPEPTEEESGDFSRASFASDYAEDHGGRRDPIEEER